MKSGATSPRHLSSAIETFTQIHVSNNNHLNTLILFGFGDLRAWPIYRISSLFAGVASVGWAAGLAGAGGRLEAIFAAIANKGPAGLRRSSVPA